MTKRKPIKILLNYDYKLYPFTTASYFELAAQRSPLYENYRKDEIAPYNVDFIINFETCDSIITSPLVPSAYYEIDNHLIRGNETWNYEWVDIVFIAQEINKEFYPPDKTHVLPLAADPQLHRPFPDTKQEYDIGFIGNDTYPERNALLRALDKNFKLLRTNTEPGLPYSQALAKCKLAFNRSMNHDVNMRFFESMSCGKCFLTDYLPENSKFAIPNQDFFEYKNEKQLIHDVKCLLKNNKLRELVGKNARANIKHSHTYLHRLNQAIEIMRQNYES